MTLELKINPYDTLLIAKFQIFFLIKDKTLRVLSEL